MPGENPPTVEDLESVPWNEVISESEKGTVNAFSSLFFDRADAAADEDDEQAVRVYRFFGHITSMYMDLQDSNDPLGPRMVLSNGRTAIPEDFSDQELDLMKEKMPDIQDPDLRARVGDILWITRQDHEAAETAVGAYLESADNHLDPEEWVTSGDRIERAFQIASMLRNQELRQEVQDFAIEILDEYDGEDSKYLSHKLLTLLFDHQLGDLEALSDRAKSAATKAEDNGDWRKTKELWLLKARFDRNRGAEKEAREAERRAGEALVKRAEQFVSDDGGGYGAAAWHLSSAVELLRRAGASDRAEEVHRRLLNFQERSVEEMGVIETEMDATDIVEQARDAVSGKTAQDALQTLAMLAAPPHVDQLEERVEELSEETPLQALMPMTVVSEEGKPAARRDSVIGPQAESDARRAEMIRLSHFEYGVAAQALIDPARRQILTDHRLRIADFLRLCSGHPFVPPGREQIFARGLYRGLVGDFTTACHLLVPQIENSLRYLLARAGVITSSLQSDGIQEEYSLGRLVEMDELADIFDEDLIFTLDSVLNSKFGSNLRHRLAHGLLDKEQFQSAAGTYAWWLVLHLLYRPIVAASEEDETKHSPPGVSDEEE